MSTLDWILSSIIFVLYLGILFTMCGLTFQKGHLVLGIVGIFVPLLWLIGAILPARPGSPYAIKEARRLQTLGYSGSQVNQPDITGLAGPAAT